MPLSTRYRKHHLTPPGQKARREPATSEPATKRPNPPPSASPGLPGRTATRRPIRQAGHAAARRSWFRFHQLFADFLNLELRRTAPGEVGALHQIAAGWLAGHGYAVEAIRHAQAAQDWVMAARLLADHWPGLRLDGRGATIRELLAGFPAQARAADAELVVVAAADELRHGSMEGAERFLGLAGRGMASVPEGRRAQAHLLLGIARLLLARQRGDLPAMAGQARRLQEIAEAHDSAQPGLSQDLRALALIGLDSPEVWTGQFQEAERHLDEGVVLARRIGRPYLEFTGLAHLATVEIVRSFAQAADHCRQAIELAELHGWTGEPAAVAAYMTLGAVLTWQGRLEEAEPWIQRAERAVRAEAQPVAGMGGCFNHAALELGRDQDAAALAALQAAAGRFAGPVRRVLPAHRAEPAGPKVSRHRGEPGQAAGQAGARLLRGRQVPGRV